MAPVGHLGRIGQSVLELVEVEFNSEKELAVKTARRIVVGIKNQRTAVWSNVRRDTDQDGVFGQNGDIVTGRLII